jgi:DNA (cytosine-5)-methyltransferase 1
MSEHPTAGSDCSFWPTVTTSDSNGAGAHGDGGADLRAKAAQWPTPTVNGNHNVAGMSPTSGDGLETKARQWPTPAARDWKDGRSNLLRVNARPLNEVATAFLPPVLTPTGQQSIQHSGQRQLNPRFVEWLMGLPDGWTSAEATVCACSATESCPYRQRRRSHT